jgi:hypothetical protein
VRRARRGRLSLLVRAIDAGAPQTAISPGRGRGRGRGGGERSGAAGDGVLMMAVDRKERIARVSVVGPAGLTPEQLPIPAHGAGSFDEGQMRVVWAEVPVDQAARAAQAVYAALMA